MCGARPVPHLQQEDDLTANMPVYTNIRKIHLTPFDTKFIVRKLFFFTDLFGNQSVYTYIHGYETYMFIMR